MSLRLKGLESFSNSVIYISWLCAGEKQVCNSTMGTRRNMSERRRGTTSFPGSLFFPPNAIEQNCSIAFGGKKRDPGNEVGRGTETDKNCNYMVEKMEYKISLISKAWFTLTT